MTTETTYGINHHPSRILRPKEVAYMLGVGQDMLLTLRKEADFPRPVQLSSSTKRNAPIGFLLGDIENWIKQRAGQAEE